MDFKAYTKVADQHYREHYGLDFEQFEPGQTFQHRPGVTISQQDNKEEALDTINNAQLHYDLYFAQQTEWQKNLGVSTMTLQKVIGMTYKTLGRKLRITQFDDIAMTHPVFDGDTLYAETHIDEVADYDHQCGLVTATTQGINQDKDVVTKITYQVLIYKRGQHPLEQAHSLTDEDLTDDKFNSHKLVDDKTYRETVGLYYESLMPDEVYEHWPGKTFTAEESRLHALRSLDFSPQYSDQHYASTHNDLGKIVIAEPFVVGVVTALTTRTFDRVVANLGWNNIKLEQPVYAGDTIYAQSTILDKRESNSRPTQGIMHVESKAYNQNQQLVCSYERYFLIYKQGEGPYKQADY